MRKLRFLVLFLCVVLISSMISIKSEAHVRKEHDKIMLYVLFRKFEYASKDASVQDEISVLTDACYLTIDQFNKQGQASLDELLAYGINGIPQNVSEINYKAGGNDHRSKTHRGWNVISDSEMKTIWPIRQNILRNTVGTVFDFDDNEKQKEAFCELLYYIHILGDHQHDQSYKIKNGLKIDVGGRHDKEDIIHKILELLPVLFPNQTNTHKYRALTTKLRSINNKFDKLVNSDGGINNEEKFAQKQELVKKVIKIMSLYLPEMLKKESFFNQIFYSNIQPSSIIDWLNNLLKAA